MSTANCQIAEAKCSRRSKKSTTEVSKQTDNKHTKSLPPLKSDDVVRYQTSTSWEPAVIIQRHSTPRSYNLVTTSGRTIRRNRRHLKLTQDVTPEVTLPIYDDDVPIFTNPSQQSPRPAPTSNANTSQQTAEKCTRSGRLVKPPQRYGNN